MESPGQARVAVAPEQLREVLRILAEHAPGLEVRAFGSRVRGTAKPHSDLDLALMTTQPLSLDQEAKLHEAFDESSLPFKVDLLDWAATSASFQTLIWRDGVIIQQSSPTR